MRYHILTLHKENDIVFTATHEKNEKDFFSGETVDGIVVYIEQWNNKDDKFDGMSMLLAKNETKILKNDFAGELTAYFIKKINAM